MFHLKINRILVLSTVAILCAGIGSAWAQEKNKPEPEKKEEKKSKLPEAISKIMEGVAAMPGMTPVYVKDNQYYLEIADSLLGRDILMVSRIAEASGVSRSNTFGYAGDYVQEAMLRFTKGPEHRLFLTKVATRDQAPDSTSSMYGNVIRSNRPAIIASFNIAAYGEHSALIEVTDLVKLDNAALWLPAAMKSRIKLGALDKEKSYVESVKTWPINTELRAVKTYLNTARNEPCTMVLNCSWVLLPKEPMQPRYADARIGYFTENYFDYDANPQTYKAVKMISRWRLEPKPEDRDRYLRGELVEPAKPIVFYIDPTTPKEWVPYLIAGVNDWQPAFEKAGFKNAIYALEAPTPEEDPSWSLEDARHSAIIYKPSTVANASGPHVSDPRSGEIIESHINWYHNVMSLVHHWYMVQCSAVDPQARAMTFPSSLMGQLIRFVSSHEVGHTLGLRHNFAGSNHYTVAQLRDTAFCRINGHATSIMDYARFNYVAQPEDGFPQELLFPRISHYDMWAIEWGYRRFDLNASEERTMLNRWVMEKLKNPYLHFNMGGEGTPDDPRGQSEDLGANQIESNTYGIMNLKRVMAGLPEWTRVANEDYFDLRTMVGQVQQQFIRYMNHVGKWVGAVLTDAKTVEQAGPVYSFPSRERQEEAMAFLHEQLFVPPLWLTPAYITDYTGKKQTNQLEDIWTKCLNTLVTKDRLANLLRQEEAVTDAYTCERFFDDLRTSIFGKMGKTDAYKRSLQNIYVERLCKMMDREKPEGTSLINFILGGGASDYSDVNAIVRAEGLTLEKKLKGAGGDSRTKAHYNLLYHKLHKMTER